MEENPQTSALYQTTLRLIGRLASTRETLSRLTHLAAAEGRIDLALSLGSLASSLDQGETEAVAVLRNLEPPAHPLPHEWDTPDRARAVPR